MSGPWSLGRDGKGFLTIAVDTGTGVLITGNGFRGREGRDLLVFNTGLGIFGRGFLGIRGHARVDPGSTGTWLSLFLTPLLGRMNGEGSRLGPTAAGSTARGVGHRGPSGFPGLDVTLPLNDSCAALYSL